MKQRGLQFGDDDQLVEKVDEVEVVLLAKLESIHLDEARGETKKIEGLTAPWWFMGRNH